MRYKEWFKWIKKGKRCSLFNQKIYSLVQIDFDSIYFYALFYGRIDVSCLYIIEMNVFTRGLKTLCMTQMMKNTGLLP